MNSRIPYLSLIALGILCAPTPALKAAEIQFGAQAGLAFPICDLKAFVDSKVGGTLGLNMLLDFGGGQALRPRLEFTAFEDSQTSTVGAFSAKATAKANAVSLGADYLYFFDQRTDKGLYALGGAGLSSNELSYEVKGSLPGFELTIGTVSHRDTQPYFDLGAGYQFNRRWGVEARYNDSRWKNPGSDTLCFKDVTLSATFRF